MKTIMVLLLLLLGIVPAHGAADCEPPDCPVVVDALDGPVHERAESSAAVLKLRNGASRQDVEVSYRFVDGTAKLGEDYKAVPSGTVTIKAGQTSAGVPYTVLRVSDQQKQFSLQITAVRYGQIGKGVAVFTIGGKW
ncbi:Calx-beta domain-containing protein [Nocardia sp. NRRL S-836]|uniref:Calx-beta domain-containing protein n=1 Tax=Nocardia sp. NRRL S-836 TaxID=1519492 RepID=UPI0006AE55D2|nr:Calx-beta domain-containing protein [Nocardia sp. NRRL S-836]KOV83168.1 hypothetical protein ADL03_21720 [Nocardia sp. NRRL S-836]